MVVSCYMTFTFTQFHSLQSHMALEYPLEGDGSATRRKLCEEASNYIKARARNKQCDMKVNMHMLV